MIDGPATVGDVPDDVRARLAAATVSHTHLSLVLRDAAPRGPVRVVRQDEYAHDVVMAFEGPYHAVYDVT